MDTLPYIERVKIQCEILLPLFRRLREELGNERASEMLRAAVSEHAESIGRRAKAQSEPLPLRKLKTLLPEFAAADALDFEALADTESELSLNVTRCAYAEYFHSIGEPEFGAMLTCELDPPMTAAIDPDLSLERSKTIMAGDKLCDFRWRQT